MGEGGSGETRMEESQTFKILYTNVRSVVNKMLQVKAEINESKLNLVCFCEIFCNSDTEDAFLSIDGYSLAVRQDGKDTEKGKCRGLLIYAKAGTVVAQYDTDEIRTVNEACAVQVSGWEANKSLTVVLAYRPPRPAFSDEDKGNTEAICRMIKSLPSPAVLVGDMNCPTIDWNTQYATQKGEKVLLEAFQDAFWTQHVLGPTHRDGNCLDIVGSSEEDLVASVESIGRLSDHDLQEIELLSPVVEEESLEEVPDWAKLDIIGLRTDAAATNWTKLFANKGTESMWKAFKSKMEELSSSNLPTKRRRTRHRPQWMTKKVEEEIKTKRRLWKKYRSTKESINLKIYLQKEKEVKNLVRRAKRDLERKLVKDCKVNSRPLMSYMKSMRGNRVSVGPFKMPVKDTEGEVVLDKGKPVNKVISDKKGMAEALNKTYAAVFTKDDPLKPIPDIKPKHEEGDPLVEVKFTEKNVHERLKKIRPSSAPGPDKIWPRLLVLLADLIAKPLAQLFTASMEEGVVPKDWKDSNIAPILKPQKPRYDPSSYRGVSMTSQVCKCMEGITKDEILKHVEKHSLLSKHQHGGRPGRSTLTNLLCWLKELGERVDKGEPMDALYCDFLKAYDVVSHRKLKAKLEKRFGVKGKLLLWIGEWLRDRRQRVIISGQSSEWTEVLSSIIQGSVLSMILFLLYIDDTEDELEEPEDITMAEDEDKNDEQQAEEDEQKPTLISIFVDDTKTAMTVRNAREQQKMQRLITRLGEWSIRWDLRFNVDKCKVFARRAQQPKVWVQPLGKTFRIQRKKKMWVSY